MNRKGSHAPFVLHRPALVFLCAMSVTNPPAPPTYLLAAVAVALCGAIWGLFWLPLHWLEGRGVGGGWTSFVFNVVSLLAPLPFLLRRAAGSAATVEHDGARRRGALVKRVVVGHWRWVRFGGGAAKRVAVAVGSGLSHVESYLCFFE